MSFVNALYPKTSPLGLPGTLLLIVIVMSCNKADKNPERSDVPSSYCLDSTFKTRLSLVKPSYGKVTGAIHLTGSVEENPDRMVSFVSLVSGVVTRVNFSIGDRVSKGQVLAEIRSTELSFLQSETAGLKSRIELAESKLKSVKTMFDDGIASRKDLQEAQSELDILLAERSRNQENLAIYSASPTKGVFEIKAPASGIVTSKNLNAGAQISPETGPLFTISDLNQLWVMANIYATDIQHITPGMEVAITTLSYPEEQFEGKISTISAVMDEEAKVLKARIELPNKDMKLKPGMLVDIIAHKPTNREAISVPTSCIVFDDNQNYVVEYKNDCNLIIRRVEILAKNNGTTFLSSGPDTTANLVAKNQLLLFEQLKNFQR